YFPPTGGGGVQRPLKFAQLLPDVGLQTNALAPSNAKWRHQEEPPPALATRYLNRAPFLGPRGRLPAEELYGRRGGDRLLRKLWLTPRRFLLPDEDVTWLLTALPGATGIVHRERIDAVLTTSQAPSLHLI